MLDRDWEKDFSEQQLIERVRSSSLKPSERKEALKFFVRLGSLKETELLTTIATDRTSPGELRATAAVVLGKKATPEHQRALISALYEEDRDVVRRAAEGLGRIGDREALSWLEKLLAVPAGPAAKAIDFAKVLISYRLSLGSHRLPVPTEKPLPIHPDRRTEIRAASAPQEKVQKLITRLRRELPGIDVDFQSAVEMSCAGNEFLAFFHHELANVRTADMIPLVVLKHYSTGSYGIHLYVLTHPESDGTIRIFGVRPTGSLIYTGRARISGRELTFSIEALNTTHSPGVELDGVVDIEKKQLKFSRALINSGVLPGQRRPRRPRPV